jgi:hypothetical protein
MLKDDAVNGGDNYTAIGGVPQTISGRAVARQGKTKSQKAAIAAMIILGELKLDNPTKKQLAKMFGVSMPLVNKAIALNVDQRKALRKGWYTLADIPTALTDKKIEDTVVAAGVDRVWAIMEPLI